ncbi:hypothetical protein KL930_002343 [Ogataea haglerorum]|uniref:Nitrogen permease regulator 3 n=1 Tax=Ogataea haglerorum TaxID=1937702 RepID=A0ABQ7RMC2_9ASCO|nr:hypothetical protein KL915_001162 [Ogataea haglerorum]KAG7700473.1 hypothetical protein KL951_000588 [Ogataea haglerorum]KAG7709912.1 hypothetical protein KL914_000822 [Ogataea haglerorum]KAG7720605.1 hypothetical protein KL913_001505 [Ogataea haglerorum]KAG7720991.1 hypothetical protein KL949_001863 [Ogataea haglerorum]
MSSLFLPNPCLLGILLSISTHDGNQLVFHYPPQPNEYGYRPTPLGNQVLNTEDDDYSSSSNDEIDDELLDINMCSSQNGDDDYSLSAGGSSRGSMGAESNGSGVNMLGSSTNSGGKGLLGILDEQDRKRKDREHKRRNLMKNIIMGEQVGQTDTSGSIRSPSTSLVNGSVSDQEAAVCKVDKLFGFDVDFVSELVTPPKQLCNSRFEVSVEDMAFLGLPIHVDEDGNWRVSNHTKSRRKKTSRKKKVSSSSESSGEDDDGPDHGEKVRKNDCLMYMFHLVFVMNPPVIEYNHRIDEMFHYIVSRMALLLRYEQQKSNYVWNQSKLILDLREEFSTLPLNEQWKKITEKSSLARMMAQTFKAVSNSEIINIEINNKMRSFQIPIRTEFSSLPPRHTQLLPGSTLSSTSPFNTLGLDLHSSAQTNDDNMIHYALIMLDDPESVIRDIQAEKHSLIANFIRMIKPSESLSRLATLSGLDIAEVKLFANHLVYWRRAKAFLPLSPRNIYIVSPLAPLSNVYTDSNLFKQHFPNLPPLANFLSLISSSSSKPRPINAIIPSKDHRDLYLDAIAWLLRHGYITQLQTFLYLRITKEVKIKVEEELEMERKTKKNRHDGDYPSAEDEDDSKKPSTDNTTKKREQSSLPYSLSRSAGSDLNLESQSKLPGTVYFEEEEEEDTILLDPQSATAQERRWIAKCVEGQPLEVLNLFYKLLKYMNGKTSLELLMVKENISRQDVRKLLVALDKHVTTVRHW